MTVFIVHMRRWGGEETHSYIYGVYSTKELAEKAGAEAMDRQDRKYEPNIVKRVVDDKDDECAFM